MMSILWKGVRKNIHLILLLLAIICIALSLKEALRGIIWSLLIPVSVSATVLGWGVSMSPISTRKAWMILTLVGLPTVFIYASGSFRPLGNLVLVVLSLIPQTVSWFSGQVVIDFKPLQVAGVELVNQVTGVFIRLWEWGIARVFGTTISDPVTSGLAWTLLLWLVGNWAAWQFRRKQKTLLALTPGGVILALVLYYNHGEIWWAIAYLATLLILMGLSKDRWLHEHWQSRGIDYSESIAVDSLIAVGLVSASLVLLAGVTPSLSWRDLRDKIHEAARTREDLEAEPFARERPPNVANREAYRSVGLPRQLLVDTPPELLQEEVLTIRTGDLPPLPESLPDMQPPRYRWRTLTYDTYSGGGWSSSSAQEVPLPANTPLLQLPDKYREVNQNIRRAPNLNAYVFWSGILAQVDEDAEVAWRTKPPTEPDLTNYGDMLGALTGSDEYNVVSYVPQVSVEQLRAAGNDYPPEIIRRYLQIPESTPNRVLALARELTQAEPTPYDRAVAIESYLRAFPYSLEVEPPPPGRDVVDYFLFSLQKGYCDYYASSMVLLARAAGLPARIVIGYATGDYNFQTAEYIVRGEDAHSWVEIYFPGIGWVEFEPTASLPTFVRSGEAIASETPPELPGDNSILPWLKRQWRQIISTIGGQIAVAGIGIMVLILLGLVGEMGFLHLLPVQQAVHHIYSQLENTSAHLLPNLPGGHTPCQLQSFLCDRLGNIGSHWVRKILSPAEIEVNRLVALYNTQVFSQHPPERSQLRHGIRSWSRLRWRLWIAITWLKYGKTKSV